MARHRNRRPGLWTLIIVGVVIAWFVGRSSTTTVVPPTVPATQQRVDPSTTVAPQATPPTAQAPTPAGSIAYVTANTLNVRDSPTTSGTKLGTLARGSQVSVTEVRDGWAAVKLSSGGVAWVSAEFLATSPPTSLAAPQAPVRAVTSGPSRSEVIRRLMEQSIRS